MSLNLRIFLENVSRDILCEPLTRGEEFVHTIEYLESCISLEDRRINLLQKPYMHSIQCHSTSAASHKILSSTIKHSLSED